MTTAKTIAAAPATDLPMPDKPTTKPYAKKTTPAKTQVNKSTSGKAPVKKVPVKAPLSKAPIKSANTPKAIKTIKAEKPKKPKLVRDSFTIPKLEYVVLEALKQRASQLKRPVKKSELLRAGIKALAALSDTGFISALDKVPTIKTGRPALVKQSL
jgi:hypothetical protein